MNIHGPQEAKKTGDMASDTRSISCRLISAPFCGTERRKRRTGDRRSLEVEQVVIQSMEAVVPIDLYPKSEIAIVVHVLESDGSILCTVINAVTLAMMNAGISMTDMVVACSVGFVKQSLCQDLTNIEQTSGGAYLPIAIKARSEDIVFMQLDSRLSVASIEGTLGAAIEGCRKIRTILGGAIKESMVEALSERAR